MCKECAPFVKPGSKFLDLGCGSAIVANAFKNSFNLDLTGADIVDKRVFQIPFKLYDGKNLPFEDNSFDSVLISYVLHHCQDPVIVLKEAKRVAQGNILIYEDLPENIFSSLLCKLHGKSFAWLFQEKKESCNFKKDKEWKRVFDELGLKVVFEKKIFSFYFKESKLFVLEK